MAGGYSCIRQIHSQAGVLRISRYRTIGMYTIGVNLIFVIVLIYLSASISISLLHKGIVATCGVGFTHYLYYIACRFEGGIVSDKH